MTKRNDHRSIERLSNPGSHAGRPSGTRSVTPPVAGPTCEPAVINVDQDQPLVQCGRRTRQPRRLPARVWFRPQVGLVEQRTLLSALPTLTALVASTASASSGQTVTFTATVSDLSPGGATPSGGTVTFTDQSGTIDVATLANGVATFATSSLAAGTMIVSASYGGTSDFAPSSTGTIVTAAGTGTAGDKNGPATAAELSHPWGIAVDSSGDLFIADADNSVVRELIRATSTVVTVAGNGKAGFKGDGGPATAAELNNPNTVAVDSAGDLFISDANNNRIREVATSGTITTIAGNGTAGFKGDGGSATAAEINSPRGLTVDSAGDVFFADNPNNRIREVEASGTITTVVGDGKAGYKGDGGAATAAELDAPNTIVVDSAGDLFIGDANNNAVREVSGSSGDITTLAGTGKAGNSGDGGPATASKLNGPLGVAVDSAGDVFIADTSNNRVREIVAATGDIITVAGTGTAGDTGDGGDATAAELNAPPRIAIDSAGDLFITDATGNVIREVTPAVTVAIELRANIDTVAYAHVDADTHFVDADFHGHGRHESDAGVRSNARPDLDLETLVASGGPAAAERIPAHRAGDRQGHHEIDRPCAGDHSPARSRSRAEPRTRENLVQRGNTRRRRRPGSERLAAHRGFGRRLSGKNAHDPGHHAQEAEHARQRLAHD